MQAGTKYAEFLEALQKKIGFTLHTYPGDTDAIGQILIGRADAVLSQDTEAAYPRRIIRGRSRSAISSLQPTRSASTTRRAPRSARRSPERSQR